MSCRRRKGVSFRLAACSALLICLALAGPAAAQSAKDAVKATGVEAGLAVHLGSTDGAVEVALTNGGRMLVHGLAVDADSVGRARRTIQAAGLYGLASIHQAASFKRLPHADNLVNLLVADLDALGGAGPDQKEILRVLAPGGAGWLKQQGKWRKTAKPRPAAMDDWTHYDHGADGNPVSNDTLVRPVTALRWYAAPTISRAGSEQEPGLRLAGGRIIYSLKDYGIKSRLRRGERNHLICRDAFSGMLLWKIPITKEKYVPYRHELIASGDRVYTTLAETGPMVALDAATGKTLVSYDRGAKVEALERDERGREARQKRHLVARLYEEKLIQAYKSTIYALDAKTGKRIWTFSEGPGRHIPLVVAGQKKVFAVIGSEATIAMRGTVAIKVGSIVGLDIQSGKELWRNRELAGNYVLRLVYHDGSLPVAYFPGSDRKGRKGDTPMSGYGHKFAVANIRAADGRTLWRQKEIKSVGGHYAITFARDGKAYVACERYIGYDLKTGEFDKGVAQRTFVNACAETRATPNYVLYGMSFADRQGLFSPRAVVRSTCDTGVFPGNGLIYCSPPLCSCLDVLAGYTATAAEQTPPPPPDAQRLVAGEVNAPPAGKAGPWPGPKDWPMFMANPKRGCWTPAKAAAELKQQWRITVAGWPAGRVVEDWKDSELTSGPITAPTAADGRVYVAAGNQHRLEARDGRTGKRLWSFIAGGRIDSPPTIYAGLCLLGCRDGWVYALRAADGKLAWKFLAARHEKRIVASGQLESPWPVLGSVMVHGGKLYCIAGRHSAIDGGLRLYKLDPQTGKMIWHARIASATLDDTPGREVPVYSNHGKIGRYYPRAAHLLVSDGRRLHHFIETLRDDYKPGELVELHASNGRWDRIDPAKMTWLKSNMMGFISRRHESIGRFDYDGVRYSDVNAAAIVIADGALYCAGGRQKSTKDKFGQLTRVALDADGKVADKPDWKAQIRHQADKRLHGDFEIKAMIVAGDRLFLAGYERYKPASALHAYSTADGRKLAQWPLTARPVRNGLIAAGARLYVSLEDGSLVCFGPG